MTRSRLADLSRQLDRGPGIAAAALFGATVAAATSWLKGSESGLAGDAVMGAAVGTCVSLAALGLREALAAKGFEDLSAGRESPPLVPAGADARAFRAGIAPFPFYGPSLSYPWSEH